MIHFLGEFSSPPLTGKGEERKKETNQQYKNNNKKHIFDFLNFWDIVEEWATWSRENKK